MIALLIGILLLVFAFYGTPLFVIISTIALLAFYLADISSSAVIVELYRLASMPILPAIPLFTFAGYLLAESNTPKRLVNLSRALFRMDPGWSLRGHPGILCRFYSLYRCVRCHYYRTGRFAVSGFIEGKLSGKIFTGNVNRIRQSGTAISSQSCRSFSMVWSAG